jgi:hypothetical protein
MPTLTITVERDLRTPDKYRAKLFHGHRSYSGRMCGSVASAQRDIEAFLDRALDWKPPAQDRPDFVRAIAHLELDMKRWTDNIDPASIPDQVLFAEWGRRVGKQGGRPRKEPHPYSPDCRCVACQERRRKDTTSSIRSLEAMLEKSRTRKR